jgi:uncharacterized membrane protein YebE (DUF533 family)
MDAKGILDQLLGSGKDLLTKSKDFAESKLGVPASGADRENALSNLGKGAAIGGLLALLLGTKSGRSVTGKAVKYGSIAAVAAVAYKTFQAWQSSKTQSTSSPPALPSGKPITEAPETEAEQRGLTLLRAMIAAAGCDGHIDTDERSRIEVQIASLDLGGEAKQMLQRELRNPLGVEQLASQVQSAAAASEVYLLSSLVVDERNPVETGYMERLAAALKLPEDLVARLNAASAF